MLILFLHFLWTCLSKYRWKDMTDTITHFEQQISSTLCSALYLVHPKIKFHISYWTKLWTTQIWNVCCSEKKEKLKKMHLGQVFQSVTSFETFFFFSLSNMIISWVGKKKKSSTHLVLILNAYLTYNKCFCSMPFRFMILNFPYLYPFTIDILTLHSVINNLLL